jgi:DNA repair photolyase
MSTEIQSGQLFSILPQQAGGLARLAAEATHVADGHNVEFRALEVRSILNRSVSRRQLSLAWSINPYRGCEFACRYCYARYTHEFLAEKTPDPAKPDFRDPNLFERLIFMKENAAWLLEQELRTLERRPGGREEEIALGTATDPYQPIERTARVTRSLLEVFAKHSGLRLGIVTKSTLIERDIDLLTEIARRNTLVLHQTITTRDAALARLLEPRAPRPDLRLRTVRRLREAGLTAGILCSPLLPGITDGARQIDGMAKAAKSVDASFFAAEPLFLKSCSRATFFEFVREHFPRLSAGYAARFRERDFAASDYRAALQRLVAASCERHGLARRSTDAQKKHRPAAVSGGSQAMLFEQCG